MGRLRIYIGEWLRENSEVQEGFDRCYKLIICPFKHSTLLGRTVEHPTLEKNCPIYRTTQVLIGLFEEFSPEKATIEPFFGGAGYLPEIYPVFERQLEGIKSALEYGLADKKPSIAWINQLVADSEAAHPLVRPDLQLIVNDSIPEQPQHGIFGNTVFSKEQPYERPPGHLAVAGEA